MATTRPTPAEVALHALVCNAEGYDKSIVRAAALKLRQMAIIGPGIKELAERLLDAESEAARFSRCEDIHPLSDGRAASGAPEAAADDRATGGRADG